MTVSAQTELTDYAKLSRLPFFYSYAVLTATAVLCSVGAPLVLFAAEIGVDADRIGLLGGIMPFFQVLGVASLPVIIHFGTRRVAALALLIRYLFLLPLFLTPFFLSSPNLAFGLIFASMVGFAVCRTLSEAAASPWSQEIIPRLVRGQIGGRVALAYLPVALIGSFLIQLWLDSQSGIGRFYPVFAVGIVIGIFGALSLFGLKGGAPKATQARWTQTLGELRVPLRDRNFLWFLYSSGSQYLIFAALNIFMLLFFRERLGISSGQLVLMAALIPVGSAGGSFATGWFVDRHGTRAIRITLQVLQVVMLLALPFAHAGIPGIELLAGLAFFLFGFLVQGAIMAGNIYMLNYVPPENRESYMALAYSSDGLFGGGLTVLSGVLVHHFESSGVSIGAVFLGGYEMLFAIGAVITASSAAVFALLREEGATGVRDFLGQFSTGNPLRALWGIQRFSSFTSEQRRRDLAYGFAGIGSTLAKNELIAALSDPSFDVRHEAIRSLGRLPATPETIRALESVLTYDGLTELQYAALDSLGHLRAKTSADKIASFLDDPNPLLRSRAVRSLGDIRDPRFVPAVRAMLADDADVDCQLAAASALGKYGDRDSIPPLVAIYCAQAEDIGMIGEPRSKVVLLAIAKILKIEERFARNWRREEKLPGLSLPELLSRVAKSIGGAGATERRANLAREAADLGTGSTQSSFAALQLLLPDIQASCHSDRRLVSALVEGTSRLSEPHRALMVLLAIAMQMVLQRGAA